MFKYMKYEIRGSYKFILGIIAIVLIASTGIQYNLFKEFASGGVTAGEGAVGGTVEVDNVVGITYMMSILTVFGAYLASFIHIIGSFRKELYEDRGYLTFTLPLRGREIVGSKFIVAVLFFGTIGFATLVYNAVLGAVLNGPEGFEQVKMIVMELFSGQELYALISFAMAGMVTLVLMYFSIALSKVSFRNKKIGGLWFVVFLVINTISGFIVNATLKYIPYYLNVRDFTVSHIDEINTLGHDLIVENSLLMSVGQGTYIHIFGDIAYMIIGVLAFIGTSYLIEKKIDI